MKKLLIVLALVAAGSAMIGSGVRLAYLDGHQEGRAFEASQWRAEAKAKGLAWHSREDGSWCWKTREELAEDLVLTQPSLFGSSPEEGPLPNAAE
jgi:hypothetical protein